MWDVECSSLIYVYPYCGRFDTIDFFVLQPKESQWLYFCGHWGHTHRQNVSFSNRQLVEQDLDHASVQEQASS